MASTQFIPSQKLISNLLGLEDLDGLERLSRAISALDAITPERTRDREMAAVAQAIDCLFSCEPKTARA
jgi:hypothetical protein